MMGALLFASMLRRACLPVALLILVGTAHANDRPRQSYQVDPERSSAQFSVPILWLMRVHGDFPRFSAELVEQDDGRYRVTAVLDATAVRMRRGDYTEWARSPEFFDAARHPQIRFESDSFALEDLGETSRLRGELSLRGRSHPATFTIRREACDRHPCAVRVQGAVRRSVYGMTTRRTTVGDRVRFELSIDWLRDGEQ